MSMAWDSVMGGSGSMVGTGSSDSPQARANAAKLRTMIAVIFNDWCDWSALSVTLTPGSGPGHSLALSHRGMTGSNGMAGF